MIIEGHWNWHHSTIRWIIYR